MDVQRGSQRARHLLRLSQPGPAELQRGGQPWESIKAKSGYALTGRLATKNKGRTKEKARIPGKGAGPGEGAKN